MKNKQVKHYKMEDWYKMALYDATFEVIIRIDDPSNGIKLVVAGFFND